MNRIIHFLWVVFLAISCSNEPLQNGPIEKDLTIFFVNDQHGQLENFSKIKYIVDQAKKKTPVIVACSGDIFSGNPVVDYHPQKGYPIIEAMNSVGFDISVLGNHEFDYGESILKDRMEQSDFHWLCANVDMGSTGIPQPMEYATLVLDDLRITFLGLIETNGKPNATIPSTHPWKVQNLTFERPENVVSRFENLKGDEDADLYIALTHIGHTSYPESMGDFQMAQQFPYFDLIIGGHTNALLDTMVNGIPIFQAGNYLNYLGRIDVTIEDKKVKTKAFELIDLSTYPNFDAGLKGVIDAFTEKASQLNEVIGYSHQYHGRYQVGCFYTDAMKASLDVDISFQNSGGVRSGLDKGEITKREIYEIDPFNNGTIIYSITVSEIKHFLKESRAGIYYSGLLIDQMEGDLLIMDINGNVLSDHISLSLGINDYIPAVYDEYFPSSGVDQPSTTAEVIISYLEDINDQVDYESCDHYFRYQ